MRLSQILNEHCTKSDLLEIVNSLGERWDDISGDTLKAKVINLLNTCNMNNKTIMLLNLLSKKNKKLLLNEQLYLIIEEVCRTKDQVEKVFSNLKLYTPDLTGYNHNRDVRITTVKHIQETVELNNQQLELFNTLIEIYPYYQLSDFDWYKMKDYKEDGITEEVVIEELYWN